MFYSPSKNGFFVEGVHSAIPSDAVEISSIEHAALMAGQSTGKVIVPGSDGKPILEDGPLSIPSEVTMRQCRLVLHRHGILAQVQPTIDALDEPQKTEAQIEWDFSTSVSRDNLIVSALAHSLSLTESQLDDLFAEAAVL